MILVPIYSDTIMFAKDLSNRIFSPPRHEGTKFNQSKFFLWVFVAIISVCPNWVSQKMLATDGQV